MPLTLTAAQLAPYLDHTKLTFAPDEHPETVIPQLCEQAKTHGMAAVCVRLEHARIARHTLGATSPVQLAVVVGFPEKPFSRADEAHYPILGNVHSTTKFQEICEGSMEGAEELDVVMNHSFFLTDLETGGGFTEAELAGLRSAADTMPIKLIIETGLLTEAQIQQAVRWAVATGIDTIKTSTGMVTDAPGATVEAVRLIRATLDELGATTTGIKASGGISTYDQAMALIEAGATRIGSSRCVDILRQAPA